ncbi:hypothetical protein FRB96_009697 [Tulasnella sp. 330]|nr:hypothetical protein FRB96_009697 [Tulasnella sp. 330]KAG8882190.1 hypothetical protein FRB97_008599 [Tulasnella sp. 331]
MPPRSSRSTSRRPPPASPSLPSPSSSTTPRPLRSHDSGAQDPPTPLLRREGSPTTSSRAGDALSNPVPQPTPPPSAYRPPGHFLNIEHDVAGGGGSSSSGDGSRSVQGKGRRDEPESSQTFQNAPLSRVVQPQHGSARYEIGQEDQDDEGASDGDSEGSSGRQVGSSADQLGSASSQGILVPTGESYQQRSRRTRQLPTSYQTAELQKLLAETAFPTTKRRDELATRIGLSSRKIQIWFQNRRQKARRAQEAQPVYPLSPTGDEQSGPPEGYPSSSTSYSSWPPPPLQQHRQHHASQPGWSPDPDNNGAFRNVYSPTSLMGRVLSPPQPGPGIMSSLPPYRPTPPTMFVHEHGRGGLVNLSAQDEGRWETDPREPWHRGSAVMTEPPSGHSRHISRRPGSPRDTYDHEGGPSSASTSMPMHVQSHKPGHRGGRPSSPTYGSSPPPSAYYHPYSGGRPSRRQGSRSRSPGPHHQRVVSMPSSRAVSPTRRRHSAQERTWDSPSLAESTERIMRIPFIATTGTAGMDRPAFEDFDLPPLNLPSDSDPATAAPTARAMSPRTRLRPTSPSARAAADATRRALGHGGAPSLDRSLSDLMSPRAAPASITAQLETQSPTRPVVLPPPFVLEPQPLWDVTSWTPFLHPRRVSWPNSPVRLNERNLPSRYPPPPGPASAEGYYLPPWATVVGGVEREGVGAGATSSSGGAGPSSMNIQATGPTPSDQCTSTTTPTQPSEPDAETSNDPYNRYPYLYMATPTRLLA